MLGMGWSVIGLLPSKMSRRLRRTMARSSVELQTKAEIHTIGGEKMAVWLKTAKSVEARREENDKVRQIVETALEEITARGDDAVREMSIKFDNWERDDFRLSQDE
ncbi:MAG: hypothetical protein ACPGVX_12490, partial [Thalassobaculaceae bacterium]